jgi:hypothetical protein
MHDAEQRAVTRGAQKVGTADLLRTLLEIYGSSMEHALQARGASRAEVLSRLAELDGHQMIGP